jgi:aspartate/methionine/tyrosine aminotransferase
MAEIEPFHVMDLLARARAMEAAGRSVIHMEVGEPDFVSPQPIIDAGIQALRQGQTHYTPALGLPALRGAIADYYQHSYGISVSPKRIIITPGASGALQLALGVLVNPGDQVLMADPGYPCNRHFVRLFEGLPVSIPVDASSGYQLTADLIERHWQPATIAAMLASPSNPTGTVIAAAEMEAILSAVAARGGQVLVDEIYHGLIYNSAGKSAGEAQAVTSALALSDDVFIINSFSKYFGMTGWRLGWLVAPEAYIDSIDRLAQNIFLAPSTPAQYAALAAFGPETRAILEQRRDEFQARRDYLLPALQGLGFDIPLTPQGAFYLYAGCSRFTNDSYALALDILEQVGVAITPGRDFGQFHADQHVRFAYTTSIDKLQQGVERLGQYLQKV